MIHTHLSNFGHVSSPFRDINQNIFNLFRPTSIDYEELHLHLWLSLILIYSPLPRFFLYIINIKDSNTKVWGIITGYRQPSRYDFITIIIIIAITKMDRSCREMPGVDRELAWRLLQRYRPGWRRWVGEATRRQTYAPDWWWLTSPSSSSSREVWSHLFSLSAAYQLSTIRSISINFHTLHWSFLCSWMLLNALLKPINIWS